MNKEEILKTFVEKYGTIRITAEDSSTDFLSSALDKYAMQIVEASVPQIDLKQHYDERADAFEDGRAEAVEQTLKTAQNLTNQPEQG